MTVYRKKYKKNDFLLKKVVELPISGVYIYSPFENVNEGGLMPYKSIASSDRKIVNIRTGQRISSKLLKLESQLNESKWFDYRFMSPAEATQIFADEFIKAYKWAHARMFDLEEAEEKYGIRKREIFKNDDTTLTRLWTARQEADKLGMPYIEFTLEGMKYLTEGCIYQRVPNVNQLYSKKVLEHLDKLWSERVRELTYKTLDPRYKNEFYCGHKAQKAYHDYQIERSKLSKYMEMSLSTFSIQNKTLPLERISQEFGESYLDNMDYDYDEMPEPDYFEVDVSDLQPSCFSVPHGSIGNEKLCDDCDFKVLCGTEKQKIMKVIEKITGSDDPKEDRKRMLARERKRRQREKERKLAEVG